MNSNDKLFLGFYICAAAVIIAITVAVTTHYRHYNETIATAVVQGANPLALTCALEDSYGRSPTCIILATKGDF